MEDQTVKNPDKGGVQSVARIFELIEVLAAHPAGASLQRLAEDAHLAKSTTHRLLGSLVSLGYAAQDGETGKYRLTLKMFEISSGIVNSMDVMSVAKVHLERLAQRTGEAVHLVIRDAQDIVYIYKTESGPMRMSSRVGLRSPLYCTGVGKAILATLTEEEVEDVWRHSNPQKLTGRTVTDLPALCAQLNEVRACGYAIDDEENELGIRCVALAIPGPGGKADSAFSISGLAPYMTPERIRRIAALALETRADILRDLGVQGVSRNMKIKEYTEFKKDEIWQLYTQVGWTAYTENMTALERGYKNSLLVLAAYENEELLGIVRVVGDGATIILVQDILVYPQKQRQGIGTSLLKAVLERYADVRQIQLVTDNTPKTVAFYQSLGFVELEKLGCCGFMRAR